MKTLLQLFATIPVTTASAERSFSSLRRLKNYLRSTMGQERLNSLAVLNIHKNIPINIDEVINIFSRSSRKIKTEDWSI
ncbi:52 kDa repressor of the inhibitor of the protein kinase-like [Aphis craccivora]|uniref:52 kDa repressor of the inhibitor of the protein kinase-like n=1 Tax=Aphis craccivora TaxID=307492 RepID=A0A6G0VXQ7_APHCR|nr:52 kDa repressor of the inhibitor of the protein kinase-like [Aphis craccivora]